MIILITGVPGAGKTLYSIGLIRDYLKEGRTVYADIEGLSMPDVPVSPADWRKTPDGSVVVYDECQRRFGSEGMRGGRSDNEIIAAMETHRHTGHDLVLITQHPNLLHAHVRRLVGRHHHLFRLFGAPAAKVFTHDRVMKTDSRTELADADQKIWQYPKENFAAYKSATVHTHKFRIPRRFFVPLGIMAALAAFVIWTLPGNFLLQQFQADAGPQAALEAAPTLPERPYERPNRQPVPEPWREPSRFAVLSGCAATATWCQCYGEDMAPVEMTETQCRDTLSRPLPYRLSSGGARRAPASRAPEL